MSPAAGSTPVPAILACHLGFLCGARKRVVVPAAIAGDAGTFEIQDLGHAAAGGEGSGDGWVPVFRGSLARHEGPMGSWLVGDFSPLRAPGVYRAALPGGAVSYPFVISDGAWSRLPSLFLDYVHGRRCGDFEDELRGPCHLDDGLRSDTGAQIDAAGGWHDAGDLRKWMVTTPLPILGFFELRDRQGFSRNAWRERPHEDDILAEASWGLRWILKMQDPVTGMFFEDVGGGGDSRRVQGMDWWQENHAGCCADNAENRWTDNRHASGDERHVRAQYNPIAQYVNATILLDAAAHFHPHYPAFSALCRQAALKNWEFMKGRKRDAFHRWTSVLSWRLLAALRLHAVGVVPESEVAAIVSVLIDLQSAEGGFWYVDAERKEPYRGILHAAQPAIALAEFVESDYENPLASQARDRLELHWTRYAQPMLATNPFGMMPYGLFSAPGPGTDAYHPWDRGPGRGLCYRFFMPTQRPGGIVHGLASHWTSWAHAFSGLARVLECDGCRQAGFDQLSWLLGNNPLGASAVTGVGYRNVVPYSRFQGPAQGGFCNGFRGSAEDEVQSDLDGALDWTTGEYWMAPLASALLALAGLVPQGGLAGGLPGAHAGVLPSSKLGAPG
jgi:hypothetical protein